MDHHLPYLWAAYRRNVFDGPEFPPGLSTDEFRKLMLASLGSIFQAGGEAWIFYGKSAVPLGMVVGHIAGERIEPHVFWFPEATPRNKLECSLKWLVDMKARYALFIWAKPENWEFFEHLCKYGAIRAVGKYRNFPGGGDAMLYQGVN